jgi:hypothetical protein
MPKHSSDIMALARLGAEHRLRELESEIDSLHKSFPHLRGASGRRGRPAAAAPTDGALAPKRRRRSKMSAAARKAVSARMKKYWAARRAAKSASKK